MPLFYSPVNQFITTGKSWTPFNYTRRITTVRKDSHGSSKPRCLNQCSTKWRLQGIPILTPPSSL